MAANSSTPITSSIEPLKIKVVPNPHIYVPNNTVLQQSPHKKVGLMPKPPLSIVPPSMRPRNSILHNPNIGMPRDRDSGGNILAAPKKRFVDPSVVPYMFGLSSSLSPASLTAKTPKKEDQIPTMDNMSSSLSSTDYVSSMSLSSSTAITNIDSDWIQCFDEEVGASYYYNSQTGEATWIPPDSL